MAAWEPQVEVNGKWSSNHLTFATAREAMDEAEDMMQRWWSVSNIRAVEVEREPTHTYVDHKLERIEP